MRKLDFFKLPSDPNFKYQVFSRAKIRKYFENSRKKLDV
jgi:hypothetical protein